MYDARAEEMVGTEDFWNIQDGLLTKHETAEREEMRLETRQRELNLEAQNVGRGFDAIDDALGEYFSSTGTIYIKNDTTEVVQVSVEGSMLVF